MAFLAATVIAGWVCGCGTALVNPGAPQVAPAKNRAEARTIVANSFKSVADARIGSTTFSFMNWGQDEIVAQVTNQGLQLTQRNSRQSAALSWSRLQPVSATHHWNSAYIIHDGPAQSAQGAGLWFKVSIDDARIAQVIADAINLLITEAKGDPQKRQADFEKFKSQAREWSNSTVKPVFPSEADRQRILAENALSEKRYEAALEYYEAGLAIAPFWPEGHYNAALLAAELEAYNDAIDHMRRYLELAPNAADAPAARTKLVVWEEKAR